MPWLGGSDLRVLELEDGLVVHQVIHRPSHHICRLGGLSARGESWAVRAGSHQTLVTPDMFPSASHR